HSPGPEFTIRPDTNGVFNLLSWVQSCIPITVLSAPELSYPMTNWVPAAGPLAVDGQSNTVTTIPISKDLQSLQYFYFYGFSTNLPIITSQPPVAQTAVPGSNVTN